MSPAAGGGVDVLAVLDRARDVLGDFYFKYQRRIGPYATQARLRAAEYRRRPLQHRRRQVMTPQEKLASRCDELTALCWQMIREAAPATSSAQTYFVPKCQLEKLAAYLSQIGPMVEAREVFRIAGGDVECEPNPSVDSALTCLLDLRQCYDERGNEIAALERSRASEHGEGGVVFGDTTPPTPSADRLAYEGARQDLLDWKGRAQRAEARLRNLGWGGIDASEPPTPSAPDPDAELAKLRELCGCAYQFAGCHGAPEAWLDALGDAANGTPLAEWRVQSDLTETLLPYTPSAPVVDDAMVARAAAAYSIAINNYGPALQRRSAHEVGTRAALTAALSGMSAPVGVGWLAGAARCLRWLARTADPYDAAEAEAHAAKLEALTPPAAAQRSDKEQHVNAIRILWEMGWRWKGGKWVAPAAAPRVEADLRSTHHVHRRDESLPCYCDGTADHPIGQETPAASEGGLPELAKGLEEAARRMRGKPLGDYAEWTARAAECERAANLIRRLAASGRKKIDPSWPLSDRVEFALRDAGFDYDEAFRIAQLAASGQGDVERLDWKRLAAHVTAALEVEGWVKPNAYKPPEAFREDVGTALRDALAQQQEASRGYWPPIPGDGEHDWTGEG